MPMGGNPWANAAASYGQDLDKFGQIKMQGMQQAAQAPLSLYDRFMDGYEKARARAMQEKQMEMQQAQLDRQNRLASVQEDRANEQERQNMMMNRLKIADYLSKRLTGERGSYEQAKSVLGGSGFEDILPPTTIEPDLKAGTTAALGGEALPLVPYETASERYPVGSEYEKEMSQFEREQGERERSRLESENLRRMQISGKISGDEETRLLRERMFNQGEETKRLMAGMRAGISDSNKSRSDDYKRQNKFWDDKKTLEFGKSKTATTLASAEALLNHKGLPGIVGITGAFPNIPGGDAAEAQTYLDYLKSAGTLEELTKLRQSSPTGGAVGNASDRDMELLGNAYGRLQKANSVESMKIALKEIIAVTKSIKTRNETFFFQKHGGGPGSITNLASEYSDSSENTNPPARGGERAAALIALKAADTEAKRAIVRKMYKDRTGEDL